MRIHIDPNWQRIRRWCVLGAIAMVLWLLAPVVTCSWQAFRDEPLTEAQPVSDGVDRPPQDRGFFARWGSAIELCYARTPLLGQEAWKRNLLFAFAGLAVVAHVADRIERRRKRTFV